MYFASCSVPDVPLAAPVRRRRCAQRPLCFSDSVGRRESTGHSSQHLQCCSVSAAGVYVLPSTLLIVWPFRAGRPPYLPQTPACSIFDSTCRATRHTVVEECWRQLHSRRRLSAVPKSEMNRQLAETSHAVALPHSQLYERQPPKPGLLGSALCSRRMRTTCSCLASSVESGSAINWPL